MNTEPLKEEIKHLQRRLETLHKERDAAMQDSSHWLWVATTREKERAYLHTEVERLREVVQQVHALADEAVVGTAVGAYLRMTEIHKLTKKTEEG